MLLKNLFEKAVIELEEGTEIAKVRSLLLNKRDCSIKYVLLDSLTDENRDNIQVISISDIVGIGNYAITVKNENDIHILADLTEDVSCYKDLMDLIGESTISENGDFVGKVTDILVDEDAAMLVGIQVSLDDQGSSAKIFAENIKVFGKQNIIVNKAPKQTYSLKSLLSEVKGQDADKARYAPIEENEFIEAEFGRYSSNRPDFDIDEPIYDASDEGIFEEEVLGNKNLKGFDFSEEDFEEELENKGFAIDQDFQDEEIPESIVETVEFEEEIPEPMVEAVEFQVEEIFEPALEQVEAGDDKFSEPMIEAVNLEDEIPEPMVEAVDFQEEEENISESVQTQEDAEPGFQFTEIQMEENVVETSDKNLIKEEVEDEDFEEPDLMENGLDLEGFAQDASDESENMEFDVELPTPEGVEDFLLQEMEPEETDESIITDTNEEIFIGDPDEFNLEKEYFGEEGENYVEKAKANDKPSEAFQWARVKRERTDDISSPDFDREFDLIPKESKTSETHNEANSSPKQEIAAKSTSTYTSDKSETVKQFIKQQKKILPGKIATRDILLNNGKVLIEKGNVITIDLFEKAQRDSESNIVEMAMFSE